MGQNESLMWHVQKHVQKRLPPPKQECRHSCMNTMVHPMLTNKNVVAIEDFGSLFGLVVLVFCHSRGMVLSSWQLPRNLPPPFINATLMNLSP